MDTVQACIKSYERLKNLKLVGLDVGIPWQTVYVYLKRNGVRVVGDKARYGSATDRIAVIGEQWFKKDVPDAIDNNQIYFQSTIDFTVDKISVDVKTSQVRLCKNKLTGEVSAYKWCFYINKQRDIADFFVLYAIGLKGNKEHVFLLPRETATSRTTISIPISMNSKWSDYKIDSKYLSSFFKTLAK